MPLAYYWIEKAHMYVPEPLPPVVCTVLGYVVTKYGEALFVLGRSEVQPAGYILSWQPVSTVLTLQMEDNTGLVCSQPFAAYLFGIHNIVPT